MTTPAPTAANLAEAVATRVAIARAVRIRTRIAELLA